MKNRPVAPKKLNDFSALMEIVSTLRGPQGCPWDKEQNAKTLAPYAVEEVYEMVEAIESGKTQDIKEELGDVLFQVALQTQVAQEQGEFTIDEVLTSLNEKMIRRHPHVFGEVSVHGSDEVWANWEKIKQDEKKKKNLGLDNPFSSIPAALPALQSTYKIGVKTEKLKFDWDQWQQVREKITEEIGELDELLFDPSFDTQKSAQNEELLEKLQHELGDVLFSVAQLARHLEIEPEQALRKANLRFQNRFLKVLELSKKQNLQWENLTNPQKEDLWQQVKKGIL